MPYNKFGRSWKFLTQNPNKFAWKAPSASFWSFIKQIFNEAYQILAPLPKKINSISIYHAPTKSTELHSCFTMNTALSNRQQNACKLWLVWYENFWICWNLRKSMQNFVEHFTFPRFPCDKTSCQAHQHIKWKFL